MMRRELGSVYRHPGMLRCTLGADARANADVEAANAGSEVNEDG